MMLRTLLASCALSLSAFAFAGGQPSQLNVPAGSLASALKALMTQTDIQLVYQPEQLKDIRTAGVKGVYSAQEAVGILLKGTKLKVHTATSGAMVISVPVAGEVTSGSTPSDQLQLAVLDAAKEKAGQGEEADEGRQVTVQGAREKPKPWSDGNMDTPRTIDDAQPYYIFDAKTIERSGALNVEEFLKQRLTMNAVALSNMQDTTIRGNISKIDLRGVGADKTLILVNGRRLAEVNIENNNYQPDLNGIPLSAIDRIEVLPSSASGIYGGSAIGGVVNVVLKRDYSGGALKLGYDNTVDGDSPRRTGSASYGMSLEGGRTHVDFSATWSEQDALRLMDRQDLFRANLETIQRRSPGFVFTGAEPFLGSLPNIGPTSGTATTLVLKNGNVPLNSRNTFVPAGTSTSTTAEELAAGLLANAGQWNLDFPLSTRTPTGLLRMIGSSPRNRSLQSNFRRRMLPWLEVLGNLSWNENRVASWYHPITNYLNVPANALSNPFTTTVAVQVPDGGLFPSDSGSQNRSATVGILASLAGGWTGTLDYTWSENRYNYLAPLADTTARTAAILNGTLNPFVDSMRNPIGIERFSTASRYKGSNELRTLMLRASGPLPALPWGRPMLTAGLEQRAGLAPERTLRVDYPVTVNDSYERTYYARESTTRSAYMEATAPLVKADLLPGLHALDLQLSGRGERYRVGTGTNYANYLFNRTPPATTYGGTTLNGQPYFSEAAYTSANYTVGLRYQPVEEVTLRVSRATAFLPPTPAQLLINPVATPSSTAVIDPTLAPTGPLPAGCTVVGATVRCPIQQQLSGGNPDLEPQNSRSFNAGLIWAPGWQPLEGLRLNAEYYRIEQFDAIATLTPQQIVDQEPSHPGRVERNTAGAITLVDTSMMNLYHRETEGWDLSVNYALRTRRGEFSLYAVSSILMHLKDQYAQGTPEGDAAGYSPGENGATKYKTNMTLSWETGPWTASWSARYFGSYRQYGVAGGPASVRRNGGSAPFDATYALAQGSDTVPSQIYHDLLVSHSFGRAPAAGPGRAGGWFDGLSMQMGVRNIFDKAPPLDTYYYFQYFFSPYGDLRLRSYWLNLSLDF